MCIRDRDGIPANIHGVKFIAAAQVDHEHSLPSQRELYTIMNESPTPQCRCIACWSCLCTCGLSTVSIAIMDQCSLAPRLQAWADKYPVVADHLVRDGFFSVHGVAVPAPSAAALATRRSELDRSVGLDLVTPGQHKDRNWEPLGVELPLISLGLGGL
eukprot:TRINITY_DN2080_c0_g1_i2.p1 TRINITY_DN2080_c0_g1~~TRINITY_DN2080_c0_g1_i2.p1  ORF type:complete len:158 (+),score=25.41 TRINITY_DN2080_c0_g1_i2:183-656(+)